MSEEKPVISQKGPYVKEMEPGTYWWCSCGLSGKQPFCDGSHKGTAFSPEKLEVKETKKIAWCGCRYSKRGCICDGAHNNL